MKGSGLFFSATLLIYCALFILTDLITHRVYLQLVAKAKVAVLVLSCDISYLLSFILKSRIQFSEFMYLEETLRLYEDKLLR